jgi:hypothetical protein
VRHMADVHCSHRQAVPDALCAVSQPMTDTSTCRQPMRLSSRSAARRTAGALRPPAAVFLLPTLHLQSLPDGQPARVTRRTTHAALSYDAAGSNVSLRLCSR